jgi:ribosome-binding protein aMBF1 (putative translation factor)
VTECDLCGKSAPCIQKEIDGRVFDFCASCWRPLAEKLSGKGRAHEVLTRHGNEQQFEEYDEISTY